MWSIGRRVCSKRKLLYDSVVNLSMTVIRFFYCWERMNIWTSCGRALHWLNSCICYSGESEWNQNRVARPKSYKSKFFNENSKDSTTINQRETRVLITIFCLNRYKYENYQNNPIPFLWYYKLLCFLFYSQAISS